MSTNPEFAIIGAQKSATTFLQTVLQSHPEVFIPDGELAMFEDPQYADMARLLAEEILEENVEALAGERHSRSCPSGLSLWKVPAQMGMQSRIDPDRRGEGPDRDSPASRYSSASR